MKKKGYILCTLGLLCAAGCTNKEFQKGDGDMEYVIHHDEDGETIKKDDFLGISYTERNEEDSLTFSSNDYDDRLALQFQKDPVFKGDLSSCLALLSEGDSAVFKINVDSMIAHGAIQGRPKPRTKSNYLRYTVKVHKVIPRASLSDDQFSAAIEAYKMEQLDLARKQETFKFNRCLASLPSKPTVTASGLNYVITKAGTGPKPALGDTVCVHYTGSYLGGRVFETSREDVARREGFINKETDFSPVKVPVTAEGQLSGFKEFLRLANKGTRAQLIIPSNLAYGTEGYKGIIHAYTGIRCEVEIVDVIRKK